VARFAAQVVGVANVPLRALASLPLIGRELAGRPQVASTAGVAAGLAAMAARAVLLGAPLRSGRYRMSIAQVLDLADDLGTAQERAAVMAALRPAGAGQRPALPDLGILASDGPPAALARLAVYGVLAPSPHNTQPWQFRVAGGALRITPDATRALPVADPRRRGLAISLGCSAMSILVAAAAAGLAMTLEIGPGAGVRLAVADGDPDQDLARLFGALATRVTDKRGYPPQPVEPPSVPVPAGIGISYVADPDTRAQVADLHRQAVGELARTNSFSSELAGWLRTDQADPRRDGMTLPMPADQAGAVIAELARSGEPLRELGERDARALAAGPLVGFLTSGRDSETDWIRTGLAWQRLSLVAHASGLAVAPLTAVVEDPHARQAAAALVAPGQQVQMLFRLGTSPGPLSPTARRDPALTTGGIQVVPEMPDSPQV
jgi:nitroreductase